jgi:hypothetical protein
MKMIDIHRLNFWDRKLAMEGIVPHATRGLRPDMREFCYTGGKGDPNTGSVESQYNALLDAFTGSMPTQLGLQQTYQPAYTQTGLQGLENELMGVGGTPGYLSIYGSQVTPAITGAATAANTATRTANVGDVANLGPGAAGAVRNLNPGQSALMDALTNTATNQLNLGTQLDPTTTNNIISGVRSNWAARGLGTSQPAQLGEAMQLYGGGQSALATRESEAGSVANLNANLYTNPAMELLGGTSTAPQQAQTLTGTGQSVSSNAGPTMMPTSDLESLFNMVYNAQAASNISDTNAAAGLCGAAAGAGGNMAGSLGGAAIMCWVAREVYGENNPSWLMFRAWLLNDAPTWFRGLYIRFGERFAGWLRDKPRLKGFIRVCMDSKIKAESGSAVAEAVADKKRKAEPKRFKSQLP